MGGYACHVDITPSAPNSDITHWVTALGLLSPFDFGPSPKRTRYSGLFMTRLNYTPVGAFLMSSPPPGATSALGCIRQQLYEPYDDPKAKRGVGNMAVQLHIV